MVVVSLAGRGTGAGEGNRTKASQGDEGVEAEDQEAGRIV